MGPEKEMPEALKMLVAGLSPNMLERLTDISAAGYGSIQAIKLDGLLHTDMDQPQTNAPIYGGIRRGRRQPFEVEHGDTPRPGVLSVKTHHRPDPKDPSGLNTLPIKRATPKRPADMSARQWKKAKKDNRRADRSAAIELDNI